jgi:hypothetical protein
MGTVTSVRPWFGYPRAETPRGHEELVEFDWESLRRWAEDENSREQRADQSLRKLDHKLRLRQLRRRLVPVAGALLVPLAVFLIARHTGHA